MSNLVNTMNSYMTKRTLQPRGRLMAVVAATMFVLLLMLGGMAMPLKAFAAINQQGNVFTVNNVDDLIDLIRLSRGINGSYQSFKDKKIVLTADIDFHNMNGGEAAGDAKIQEIQKELGSLTFGDAKHPFKGEFDGQGHYIRNLEYDRNLWVPKANTGLFSITQNAYLHDVHFANCYIGADFRGGVLVGQANATRIESVRMEDCTMSVTPANNAVSLVTNAGIMGGMIAGEMKQSSMYNCTVQGGRVVNNSVVAVSGLGGEGLYLGALVGSAEDSVIEYSRVLPNKAYYEARAAGQEIAPYTPNENGKYPYLTEVYNRYEVAIGAVAGQSIYAGGIVGCADDVDVVDCFSTAWTHTWVANYVGVGSGNIGYVGGIIAHSMSDKEGANANQVIRCHFASNMESYQWNSLAIIPIIQSNKYLAGLVERDWHEDTGIYNSYFLRPLVVGMEKKIAWPDGYVRTYGNWLGLDYDAGKSVAGYAYAPIVDYNKYKDRSFWEGEGYDFAGNIDRQQTQATEDPQFVYGSTHVKKWVIDEKLGIPVHGSSVKATLDFPGAGSVSISPSTIDSNVQTTADPYDFAVQGMSATEADLTFSTKMNVKGQEFAGGNAYTEHAFDFVTDDTNNGGFRFHGWFRAHDIATNDLMRGSHKFFDPLVPPLYDHERSQQVWNPGDPADDEADKLKTEYAAHNSGTGDDRVTEFADNDLFIAYYQAQVLFHDAAGNVIDKATSAANDDTSDDWYNHQDKLPQVAEPAERGTAVSEKAKFLGWTTEKNNDTGGGWPDITNSQLADLKNAGKFFTGGEAIEKPMDLYPVYADLGSNIHVIVEGHELDGLSDLNIRDGVAKAAISGSQGEYALTLQGWKDGAWKSAENEHRDATDVLPDGYRFLGWYKVNLGDDGSLTKSDVADVVTSVDASYNVNKATAYKYDLGLRVSSNPVYQIPESDLGQPCYYYARFEYRVDYWAADYNAHTESQWKNGKLFSSDWSTYFGEFKDIAGPTFTDYKVDHWSFRSFNDHRQDSDLLPTSLLDKDHGIVAPYRVNGHNARTSVGTTDSDVDIYYDFPNSATVSTRSWLPNVAGFWFEETLNPGFQFGGVWTWAREGDGGTYRTVRVSDTFPLTSATYWIEAHNVAEVTFVDGEAGGNKVVTRAYSKHDADAANGTTQLAENGWFENNYQRVFFANDMAYEFRYDKRDKSYHSEKPSGATTTSGASPSRETMQAKRPNSYFVGWIDQSAIAEGTMTQAEYNAVYNEATRTATSLDAVLPYIVPDDALCERPMTLYPVYADYSIRATTNITRDTALADPADPAFDVDGIQMGENGVKSVVFTADVDEETAKTYELVSWTVESPEGAVIDTVTEANGAPVSNENATLTYDIRPGTPYVIVANYEVVTSAALTVTYHVDHAGDAGPGTVVYEKTYGDILGKGPQPQFADDALANAIFVGWTETAPADGAEYHVGADGLSLVDPGMYVERSMELWPVYKNVNIVVNSNIDDVRDPDDHRGWSMVTVNTSPVLDEAGNPVLDANGKPVYNTQNIAQLWAKPVDGYVFQGWYTGYADDNNLGTLLSTAPDYPLSDEAATSGETFTAVYLTHADAKEYVVRYHYPDGTVVEEPIKSDSQDAFVGTMEVTKPVLDADGKPVLDENGDPKTETVTVENAMLHGGEPTTALMQQFEQASKDPAATYYEQFAEWQWAKTGEAADMVAWDDFANAKIVKSITDQGADAYAMDLYPKTYRFSSQEWKVDEQNSAGGTFEPYAPSNLAWYIDAAATGDEQAVKVAFKPGVLYLSNRLAIQMDEVVYAAPVPDAATPALSETVTGVNDKHVGLYADFTDVSDANATPLDVEITGDDAENFADGQAIFEFQNDGSLTIVKSAPAEADNATFSFAVTQCEPDGTVAPGAKSATAYVTVQKDGDASRGTVTINLPWGYYKVTESEWGWQYNSSMQLFMDGFTNENLPEGVILVKSMSNEAQVTNAHNGETYKDGEARTKNEFGQSEDVAATKTLRRAAIPNPTAEGGN